MEQKRHHTLTKEKDRREQTEILCLQGQVSNFDTTLKVVNLNFLLSYFHPPQKIKQISKNPLCATVASCSPPPLLLLSQLQGRAHIPPVKSRSTSLRKKKKTSNGNAIPRKLLQNQPWTPLLFFFLFFSFKHTIHKHWGENINIQAVCRIAGHLEVQRQESEQRTRIRSPGPCKSCKHQTHTLYILKAYRGFSLTVTARMRHAARQPDHPVTSEGRSKHDVLLPSAEGTFVACKCKPPRRDCQQIFVKAAEKTNWRLKGKAWRLSVRVCVC